MKSVKWVALGLAVASIPVFALAQSGQTGTAPVADPAAPAAPAVTLSPKDQLTAADATLGRMRNSSVAIRRQLEQARHEKDVVKVLCLDDKLSQSDVAVRSAEDHRSAIEAAASKGDAESSSHESLVLSVLSQRSAQIAAEANTCIGEESAFTNSEQAVTNVDPNVSRSEPGGMPGPVLGDFVVSADPPQCTSCSK